MIVTFSPSTSPTSFRPWRNEARRLVMPSDDLLSRNPITGIAACCARAANGHAAAAPPSSVMKSRRLMGATPQPEGHTLSHRNGALCITAKLIVVWQKRVKLRSHGSEMARPVYLQQRTYLTSIATAVECQNRPWPPSACLLK